MTIILKVPSASATEDGTFNYANWTGSYNHGTIGVYLKDVTFKTDHVITILNFPSVIIGGTNVCGLYDYSPDANWPKYAQSGSTDIWIRYKATNPCAYATVVYITFHMTSDGYLDVFIRSDTSSGATRHHLYYLDSQISDSSSVDSAIYTFHSGAKSGCEVPDEMLMFRYETYAAMDAPEGFYATMYSIKPSDSTSGNSVTFTGNYGSTANIYSWGYVNRCTDCNIASNSQYTNGAWDAAYQNKQTADGQRDHVVIVQYNTGTGTTSWNSTISMAFVAP